MTKRKILYHFGHMHAPHSYANEEIADGIKGRIDVLNEIHFVANSKLTTIANNTGLTPEGKHKARLAVQEEVRKQRRSWLAKQNYLDEQISSVKREMKPKENRADINVTEMRQAEVRAYLNKLDPATVVAEYRAAAEDGNDLLLYAVENSPVPYSGIDDDLVTQVNLVRSERIYPEASARLRDWQLGRTNVHSALKSVEIDLRKHGIDIADDPGGLGVDAASDPIVERLRRVGAIVGPTTYFGSMPASRNRRTGPLRRH